MGIALQSPAFGPGAQIPAVHTADGRDVSPPIQWSGIPADAEELALICDDPDAPRAEPWVHWVIHGISPTEHGLTEGVAKAPNPTSPTGARQGVNDFGRIGFGGPAPPRGHGTHHYHFRLYVLDKGLNLRAGASKKELLAAMEGHVLGQGELVGTYQR